MTIHMLHGCIDTSKSGPQFSKLYVSVDLLYSYLKNRNEKYVSWENRKAGDVLTVDDGTRAGAAACAIARELGHEVTFFVNPRNIMEKEYYFFSYMDHYIDHKTCSKITLWGDQHDLSRDDGVREFRKQVKRRFGSSEAIDDATLLEDLSKALQPIDRPLPAEAAPVTIEELTNLSKAGVEIENHGWSHLDIGQLTRSDIDCHIERARAWIESITKIKSKLYAVPFGVAMPPTDWLAQTSLDVLLATKQRVYCGDFKNLFNRKDITYSIAMTNP